MFGKKIAHRNPSIAFFLLRAERFAKLVNEPKSLVKSTAMKPRRISRHEQPFERFVVHGNTPVYADLRSNRINIDTGAFATGRLTCIVIEGSGIAQLPT